MLRYLLIGNLISGWPIVLAGGSAGGRGVSNLAGKSEHANLQKTLDAQLNQMLAARKDKFLPGDDYIQKRGYKTAKNGTVPYKE